MRELNSNEFEMVNGGWTSSLNDSIEGLVWGVGDGIVTGLALGGTATASAGLGFGTIAQLAGGIIGPIVGGVFGGLVGVVFGIEDTKATLAHYRETIGTGKAA